MKIALYIILHALFPAQYTPFGAMVNSLTPASTPLVTSQVISSTLRSNFSGCIGWSMVMAGTDITVTDLGRWVIAGNSATHDVYLINQSNAVAATATVVTSGATANAYAYTSITPVTMTHLQNYYLVSKEVNGGDQWADNDTVLTRAAVVNPGLGQAVVSTQPDCTSAIGNANPGNGYVPTNLKYHL